MNQESRRKTTLVEPGLQARVMTRLSVLLLADFVFFVLLMVMTPVAFGFLNDAATSGLDETLRRASVVKLFALPILATFVCLFAQGIRETLRVAGPSYRFRQVMEAVAGGVIPRGVAIRRSDHMQNTCAAMNDALIATHDRYRQLKSLTGDLRAQAAAVQETPSEAAVERLTETVDRLAATLAEVQLVGAAPACEPLEVLAPEPASATENAPVSS